MKVHLENILCHENKDFEFTPGGNLITGKNSAGKTSAIIAITALVTHNPNPIHLGVTAKKAYIRDGSGEGFATLMTDDEENQQILWNPATGIDAPTDAKPRSNAQSCGIIDFTKNTTAKEKAKQWEDMFLPDNAADILRPHWKWSDVRFNDLLETINNSGWQGTVTIFEDKRREAKRKWREITGSTWGNKQASAWVPQEWRDDLDDESEDSILARLQSSQDALNHTKISQAVDHEKQRALDEIKLLIPKLKNSVGNAQADETTLNIELRKKRSLYDEDVLAKKAFQEIIDKANQTLSSSAPHQCPHCDKGLILLGGQVNPWYPPKKSSLDEARRDLLKTQSQYDKITESLSAQSVSGKSLAEKRDKSHQKFVEAQTELRLAENQVKSYNPTDETGISEGAWSALEQALATARSDLKAFRDKLNADRERENVVELDAMCYLLGPEGARNALMTRSMDKIRDIVSIACQVGGWDKVTIGKDYSIMCRGRSIALCANNERSKAQWVLQIASAYLTKSNIVILDATDILRDESWSGLVSIVDKLCEANKKLYFIIAATSSDCPAGWTRHEV